MAVHRSFAAGARLYCQYEVFGARAGTREAPQVDAGVELRAADGAVVLRGAPTPIAPGSDGRLVRTLVMDMGGRAGGSYDLVLQIHDAASNTRVERHEPFTIDEGAR
jgi:hypothetical protein